MFSSYLQCNLCFAQTSKEVWCVHTEWMGAAIGVTSLLCTPGKSLFRVVAFVTCGHAAGNVC